MPGEVAEDVAQGVGSLAASLEHVRLGQTGLPQRQWAGGHARHREQGNDHLQYVYVLLCEHCQNEYGANDGSDIWERRCPACQRGAIGLTY